jgi:AbrB family looped-hinge helix DNA binding protein
MRINAGAGFCPTRRSGRVSYATLFNMRIGKRGRITIPKEIRDQFGLGPETEVEFCVVNGSIVLEKSAKQLNLAEWNGRCGGAFAKLGYTSVDRFIQEVRGR